MAMKNPPRRTTIRGQKHLLAYITPEEADVLKAMGGSGEKVHGIPAFYGGFEGDEGRSQGGFGGRGRDYGGDGPDPQGDNVDISDAGDDDVSMGMSPGAMGGKIGSDYQKAPSVGDGFDVNLNKAMTRIAAAPATQRLNLVDKMIMKAYQDRLAPGLMGGLFDAPLGRTQNFQLFDDPRKGIFKSFQNQASPFGALGFLSNIFDLDPYVTTGYVDRIGPEGDGRDVVPAEYNPVTGQQNQCPEGYVFDEDLQACRMSAELPSFGTPITTPGPYEAGDYARMGLLDVAPMGMGMFAERYGAGFGTPQDFSAANLAFRRGAATRPQYFRQAPDLTGYTLLS